MTQQKITPCLWFDFKAEEAVARQPRCDDLALWRYGTAIMPMTKLDVAKIEQSVRAA